MKSEYREWIRKRLSHYRDKKKKTQSQMAKLLSIKEGTYRSYEDGRAMPSIMTVEKFCKICEITVNTFLQTSPEKKAQTC